MLDWDPLEERKSLEKVLSAGIELKPGDRVVLRPRPGARIFSTSPWPTKPRPSLRSNKITRIGFIWPSLSMTIPAAIWGLTANRATKVSFSVPKKLKSSRSIGGEREAAAGFGCRHRQHLFGG